eukprot:810404-Prymnesium_polylepis.1
MCIRDRLDCCRGLGVVAARLCVCEQLEQHLARRCEPALCVCEPTLRRHAARLSCVARLTPRRVPSPPPWR